MKTIRRLAPVLASYPVRQAGLPTLYVNLAHESGHEQQLLLEPRPYEPHIEQVFRALVQSSDVVVDIGANLGQHMVLLDTLAAEVYAFEPNPALAANLERTVSGLKHTTFYPYAVGDRTGTADFVTVRRTIRDGSRAVRPFRSFASMMS